MSVLEAIATGFNLKKLDPEAYGIAKREGCIKFSMGDQTEFKTAADSAAGAAVRLFLFARRP